jgi:hypothetical protein
MAWVLLILSIYVAFGAQIVQGTSGWQEEREVVPSLRFQPHLFKWRAVELSKLSSVGNSPKSHNHAFPVPRKNRGFASVLPPSSFDGQRGFGIVVRRIRSHFLYAFPEEDATMEHDSKGTGLPNVIKMKANENRLALRWGVRPFVVWVIDITHNKTHSYNWPLLSFKIPLILDMVPNVDPEDRNSDYYSDAFKDPPDLLRSGSSGPVLPYGPLLLLVGGFVIACTGCTFLFSCFGFRSTVRQLLGCVAVTVVGIVLFHVGLFYLPR